MMKIVTPGMYVVTVDWSVVKTDQSISVFKCLLLRCANARPQQADRSSWSVVKSDVWVCSSEGWHTLLEVVSS